MATGSGLRKHFRLGVFMPVGNNGWIMSRNAPRYPPTFQHNKEIAQLAERIGFDYIFSMAKWSGYGGATRFWEETIESFTLMSALAAVTTRLRLVASISPILVHPAIVAKMAVTFDDVSGGRAGINIVSSDNEYRRMGLYPEDFASYHHAYNTEWLQVLKLLWSGEPVDFSGEYFTLSGYASSPRPVQRPGPTIVYATGSEPGFRFAAEHCDEAFLSFKDPQRNETSRRIKAMARERGRTIKTQSNCCLILGSTDEEAERQYEELRRGADLEAIANVYGRGGEYRHATEAAGDAEERRRRGQEILDARPSALFYGSSFVGGPERIADEIEEMATEGDMDGLLLNFPDYAAGLTQFDELVVPRLAQRGLRV